MPTPARAKPRPRRIAADEAHSWARNMRLCNPSAKLVLSMLTLYVDGEGACFVGIPQLSEDTELSAATVRDRLAWLERAGAIVRHPQWIDAHGRRNGSGSGRRTSDLIQLLIESDQAEMEARAAMLRSKKVDPSQGAGSTDAADPAHEAGSIEGGGYADPPATLQRPFDSAKGLTSEPEPEPEDSPPSPSGGEGASIEIEAEEPADFASAWASWPGHEVMRRDLALAEFRLLAPEKQRLCRAAIPLFVRMQERLGRTRPPNFHLWIRNAGFEEFPNATIEAGMAPAPTSVEANSREGRAIKALYAFARTSLFENRGRVIYPLPITAQVLAFADAPDRSSWHWLEDRAQIAAWSTFLSVHIHRAHPDLLTTRGAGFEARRGLYAPWPWPPRKDGTISPEAAGDAA